MRYRLLSGLLGALLLGACTPAGSPAAGSGRDAPAPRAPATAAAPPTTAPPVLRPFDLPLVSTAATMVPFWVAAEHGIFQRYGLDPQLVPMPPATAAQALSAGSALVAIAGGSVVSAYVGGSTELVFVAGVSSKAPYRLVVRPDIQSMADLRGKSVGVSTPGSSPAVAMVEVLRRFGMEPDRDVHLTYLRDTQATVAAFLADVVQGIATSSPQADYALAEGGRLLIDMRDLNVPILGPQVATTRGLLEREPDFLRHVLQAYVDGLQYARDHPEAAVPALMRGARLDDPQLAELAYREYYDIWDPWPSEAAIQTLLDNMEAPTARTVRPAELIDDRLLRDLERSGWLAEHLRAR